MRLDRHPALPTAAVLLAMAMVVFDAGMTNVALPNISDTLAVRPGEAILVTSAYQLAVLMGLLPAAHLAGRAGGRRLFVLGLGTFTIASLLAALSANFGVLVAARFVQGLGGAAILALGIPLLRTALGRDRLGSAIGWNALNVAICAACAPAVGALIIAVGDWRWLFLSNLPLGLAALAIASTLPAGGGKNHPVDLPGILLHAASAGCLFFAFKSVPDATVTAATLGAMAAASFALLLRRELPKTDPLLPLDLLRLQPVRLAVVASSLCFVAQSAGQIALPFYLTDRLGADGLTVGAVLAGWPLAVALTSRLSNRLAETTSAAVLCAVGTSAMGLGLSAMAFFQPSLVATAACAALCGVGFGLFQVPNNRNLFLAAPENRSEAAGGMQGTARLAGQTTGSLLASLAFGWSAAIAAPHLAFSLAAAFALASAIFSLWQLVGIARAEAADVV